MVVEVPAPRPGPGEVLVRVGASLVSAGTERMLVEFAEKNILQKAVARPDLVRQVVNKASREGIHSTLSSVRNRLDTDMALGYSNAGEVLEVGAEAIGFKVGERVACANRGNSGGKAPRADAVSLRGKRVLSAAPAGRQVDPRGHPLGQRSS